MSSFPSSWSEVLPWGFGVFGRVADGEGLRLRAPGLHAKFGAASPVPPAPRDTSHQPMYSLGFVIKTQAPSRHPDSNTV